MSAAELCEVFIPLLLSERKEKTYKPVNSCLLCLSEVFSPVKDTNEQEGKVDYYSKEVLS